MYIPPPLGNIALCFQKVKAQRNLSAKGKTTLKACLGIKSRSAWFNNPKRVYATNVQKTRFVHKTLQNP